MLLVAYNSERDRTGNVLENLDGLFMSGTFQARLVHLDDLVTSIQLAIFGCSALLEDVLHIDWIIAVSTSLAPDHREAQSQRAAIQLDFFDSSVPVQINKQVITIWRQMH